jgi:hypothetical protein
MTELDFASTATVSVNERLRLRGNYTFPATHSAFGVVADVTWEFASAAAALRAWVMLNTGSA